MSQYNFFDTNFWEKGNTSKSNVWHDSYEAKNPIDISKKTQNGILDPDWQIVKIKDVEKGS